MSKYTTELRFICESLAGLKTSVGYNSINTVISTIINNDRDDIFSFDYPLFDANYRVPLERKIIRHFYTREICEETYGLWKLRLEDKMNMIMPYYNQLYNSALIEFNPLYDVDIKRTHSGTSVGNQDRNQSAINTSTIDRSNSSNRVEANSSKSSDSKTDATNHWDLYSDTPQGGIIGITGEGQSASLDGNKYLTNARNVKDNDTSNGTRNNDDTSVQHGDDTSSEKGNNVATSSDKMSSTNLDEYIEHISGKQGYASYSELLEKFRKTFLNIDAMVIEELETLFMGVW